MIITCLLPDAAEWLGLSDSKRRNTTSRWRLQNWSFYRQYARLPPIGLSSPTASAAASRLRSARAERPYTSRKFFKWPCRNELRRLCLLGEIPSHESHCPDSGVKVIEIESGQCSNVADHAKLRPPVLGGMCGSPAVGFGVGVFFSWTGRRARQLATLSVEEPPQCVTPRLSLLWFGHTIPFLNREMQLPPRLGPAWTHLYTGDLEHEFGRRSRCALPAWIRLPHFLKPATRCW